MGTGWTLRGERAHDGGIRLFAVDAQTDRLFVLGGRTYTDARSAFSAAMNAGFGSGEISAVLASIR